MQAAIADSTVTESNATKSRWTQGARRTRQFRLVAMRWLMCGDVVLATCVVRRMIVQVFCGSQSTWALIPARFEQRSGALERGRSEATSGWVQRQQQVGVTHR